MKKLVLGTVFSILSFLSFGQIKDTIYYIDTVITSDIVEDSVTIKAEDIQVRFYSQGSTEMVRLVRDRDTLDLELYETLKEGITGGGSFVKLKSALFVRRQERCIFGVMFDYRGKLSSISIYDNPLLVMFSIKKENQ